MRVEADIVWPLEVELTLDVPPLHSLRITDLGVHSDRSHRNSRHAAQPESMISMPIQGFYPDLVCSYDSPAESGIDRGFQSAGHRILTQINTELTMALGNEEERRAAVRNASADLARFERELQVMGKGQALATASYRDIPLPTQAPNFDEY